MRSASVVSLVVLFAPTLLAHPGHGSGLVAGLAHPFGGIDHLLAAVAVGLLGARCGGRSWWALPSTFMTALLVGGGLAALGLSLPAIETAIALSVLLLGALVALARTPNPGVVGAIVAVSGIAHGHAHVAELQPSVGVVTYACGFLVATATLHAVGAFAGAAAQRLRWEPALRFGGGAIAAAGVLMLGAVVG